VVNGYGCPIPSFLSLVLQLHWNSILPSADDIGFPVIFYFGCVLQEHKKNNRAENKKYILKK